MLQRIRAALARASETLHGNRLALETDDELRFHLEAEIEYNVARGLNPDEARRAALTAFGGVQRFREETRDARGFAFVDGLVRDARLAGRRLRRTPAFTLGVVATLAVGLGAVAGVGALIYGVMLRPLPYPEPDRLVRVSISTPGLPLASNEQSEGTFTYFAERARSFTTLGAYMENQGVAITEGDAPERVTAAVVTPNLLRMLGAQPAAGRLLNDADGLTDPVPLLLSHELWQRRFGGDPSVVGRTIELNRGRRLVLGVLPRGFDFPSRATAVYYPARISATSAALTDRRLTVVGRLAPGVTITQAQSELDALVAHMGERYPESAEIIRQARLRARVENLRDAMVAPVRAELTLLGIMVVALLLIVAANVATLCLLRAERLRGEVGVSRALGATHSRITQRFMVESLALALIGGALALPIVAVVLATKFGFAGGHIPRLDDIALTPGVVAALLGVATLIGVGLGVVSAARSGGTSAAEALRADVRATPGRTWRRVQGGLVAIQMALALALLLGAGLMATSLVRLRRVDIGFDPRNGAKFSAAVPFRGYSTYQGVSAFHLSLVEKLAATPGVTAAAAAMQFPSTEQLLSSHPRLEAMRGNGSVAQSVVTANVVTPGFFRVMGIPIRFGRTFAPGDLAASRPGVVLSASVARELFPTDDPIGREVRIKSKVPYPPYVVVGVSGDVYAERLTDGVLRVVYFPVIGDLPPTSTETEDRIPFMPAGMHFVVRSDLPLAVLAPAFRQAVASIDPRVPIWDVRTLDSIVDDASARTRLTMLLLGVAAAATLFLGAIGLYSVVAYAVAGRAREFAVRLALGATPRAVMRLVFRESAIVSAVGIAAGLVLSLAGTRLVRGALFEVSATDPRTYIAAAFVVLISAAAATSGPARRAGRRDPVRALRGE